MVKAKKVGPRILLADDFAMFRYRIRILLETELAAVVTEVEDGLEAYNLLASGLITDLLLTDMNMPKLTGLSLIGSVRQQLNSPIPIVLMSAGLEESLRIKAIHAGADAAIDKYAGGDELVRTISAVLATGTKP